MNVNFKIVKINIEAGTAEVMFWADNADIDVFQSAIGPYVIDLRPEVADMTLEEIKAYIAEYGRGICQQQYDKMLAKTPTILGKYQSLLDEVVTVNLPDRV